MQEPLEPETILQGLHITQLPRTVHCYGQVGSTMDLCRAALDTLPHHALPLLVVAEEQLAGRGRRGRSWLAPPGTALLCSLAIRPPGLAAERAASLVWLMGIALAEGVAEASGLRTGLKWPNDLLVAYADPPHWRKAAGILLEIQSTEQLLNWAIIGYGVNVAASPPTELVRYPAGNLSAAAGAAVDRLAVLRAVLRRADSWYSRLIAGEQRAIFETWRSLLLSLGQPIEVETAQGIISGIAEDVDHDGTLLVRETAGALRHITSGDVLLTSSPTAGQYSRSAS